MTEHLDSVLARVMQAAATTLDVPSVHAADNFFELGGDSLAVIEFCTEIERVTGYETPLEVVWDTDNFTALAQVIAPHVDSNVSSTIKTAS